MDILSHEYCPRPLFFSRPFANHCYDQSPVPGSHMIDLHCHMLPAIDDGAKDLATSLLMAEMAVADGISVTLCTPHIYPGVFPNTLAGIRRAAWDFHCELVAADIPLQISYGADIQVVPDLVASLQSGTLPTLHGSRYFLFEPPHHTRLPRLADLAHAALLQGYVPVITHPERLAYIEQDYDIMVQAAQAGAWLQLTGGSLLGQFGAQAQHSAQRFLADGVAHLLCSDGHNLEGRAPVLAEAREAAASIVGEDESWQLVFDRPKAVLADTDPELVPLPPGLAADAPVSPPASRSWLARVLSR